MMQIGDFVHFYSDRVVLEGYVAGEEYYDSEYSLRRLPVRVTRVIRDHSPSERANTWDERARVLRPGIVFIGYPASSYRLGPANT